MGGTEALGVVEKVRHSALSHKAQLLKSMQPVQLGRDFSERVARFNSAFQQSSCHVD